MPLQGLASYVPVLEEFAAHWEAVNAALIAAGKGELTLKGGYSLAQFNADRLRVDAALVSVTNAENAGDLLASQRDDGKKALLQRLKQFRLAVTGLLPDSSYPAALPAAPSIGANETRFLDPCAATADLWTRINAEAAPAPQATAKARKSKSQSAAAPLNEGQAAGLSEPLLLADDYSLENFNADIEALRELFEALATASQNAKSARGDRDALIKSLIALLRQYRRVLQSRFAADNPLVASVPALDIHKSGKSNPPAS